MQYPSTTIPKSFMGGIFPYLYFVFVNIFFMLSFEAQQKRFLLHMQFNLRLNIVNYLLIIMQQKLQKLQQNITPLWAFLLVHPPQRNNYRYSFSAHTHHFCIEPL
jgi:hypothetical protein